MCGVQATEVLFWELKFSLAFPDSCTGAAAAGSLLGGRERVCVCFRGSPAKEAAGTMSKIRRKWLPMTGKRLSSMRRSRESSLPIIKRPRRSWRRETGKDVPEKVGGDMPQGVSFLVEGCASVFPLKPLCSLWGWFACFFFQGKLAVREATSQDKEKKIL